MDADWCGNQDDRLMNQAQTYLNVSRATACNSMLFGESIGLDPLNWQWYWWTTRLANEINDLFSQVAHSHLLSARDQATHWPAHMYLCVTHHTSLVTHKLYSWWYMGVYERTDWVAVTSSYDQANRLWAGKISWFCPQGGLRNVSWSVEESKEGDNKWWRGPTIRSRTRINIANIVSRWQQQRCDYDCLCCYESKWNRNAGVSCMT